jgi:hypothetical protein
MLHNDIWDAVARGRRLLCEPCLQNRMHRLLGRGLHFFDLRPCLFNMDVFDDYAPPEMLADLDKDYPQLDPESARLARWEWLYPCPRTVWRVRVRPRRRRQKPDTSQQLLLPFE